MMRAPWRIHCPVNQLRGQLKHSWLENQVRDQRPATVINRRADKTWDRAILEIFPREIDRCRKLLKEMVEGFSPRQLVSQLMPLRQLTAEDRQQIEAAVHTIYLERTGIEALVPELDKAIAALESELTQLQEAWKTGDDEMLTAVWENFQKTATPLLSLLGELPKGVALP
ncbi:MAG: hypothetical protein F9K32_13525 [Desulfobulbaceae bacterium]|nr:MAG: hypothetical protein F9K32_13525 [Desulfobulbaceae bacterium]